MKAHSAFMYIVTLLITLVYSVVLPNSNIVPSVQSQERYPGIHIPNLSQKPANERTKIETGPSVGDIFNFHFYPGLLDYLDGNYNNAVDQMDYFIDRPQYFEMNPKQNKYMSIAHFIRGSIFMDHANGVGRYQLAIQDFEASIHWDSNNYHSYLKLAEAYQEIAITQSAIDILKSLLNLNVPKEIMKEASVMLNLLQAGNKI